MTEQDRILAEWLEEKPTDALWERNGALSKLGLWQLHRLKDFWDWQPRSLDEPYAWQDFLEAWRTQKPGKRGYRVEVGASGRFTCFLIEALDDGQRAEYGHGETHGQATREALLRWKEKYELGS